MSWPAHLPPRDPLTPVAVPVSPPGRLAAVTSLLLVVMAIVSAVGAVACWHRAGLYQQALDLTRRVTRDDFRLSEKWVIGPYIAYTAGLLIVGPLFIAWQRRHSRTARTLATPSGLGPGWAVGGWFVPIANMVLPAVEVYQSAKASSWAPGAPVASGARPRRGYWLIPVWMATFAIGGSIVAVWSLALRPVISPPFDSFDAAREAKLANHIGVVGFALLAVAALAGATMVRTLTRRQAERVAAHRPLGPQPASPGRGAWAGPPGVAI